MTTHEQPLRGVVAGLGVMGTHHLRVLSSMPDVEVVAVADPDEARRASALTAAPAHATLAEALERHGPDFVCVAVPVAQLPSAAHAALEAGAHVLVEKPTAGSEEAAQELVRAAERADRRLGVGHVERYNPAVLALREKLEAGMVGRIVQMHARRLSPFPNRMSMQGVALDLSTHDIDVMRYLSGDEVARVYAETAAPLGEDREDLLCATVRFDGGATGLLETNWVTPTKVRQLSVIGEHGMFVLDYLTQDLFFYAHPTKGNEWDALAGMRGGGEGDMTRYALQRREPLRVEWEAFLAAVRDGSDPPVSGRDGVAALSTARAIQRAGEAHEVVVPNYRSAVTA